MRVALIGLVLPILIVSSVSGAQRSTPPRGIVRVVIETDKGNITVALDSANAPKTVTNFLRYVDHGFYTGGQFHRTVTPTNQPKDSVKIGVIQGAANAAKKAESYPPIELERTSVTALRHHDGTISMARSGANSATDQFFICIGEQPALDFGGHRNPDGQGFAAFGQVTGGMSIVRAIQASPANGQTLTPPIAIRRIRRAGGDG
ncbi:MAG: peptidylprolyl isomerase [Gemmatimonadaceae bacterium]